MKESSHGRQDLIFTFVPYTIEKNQTVYDADKNPVSSGDKITGWFACDFTMEQIDWVEEEESQDASEEASEQTAQDPAADEKNEKESVSDKIVKTIEKTAEVVFVEDDSDKGIEEISSVLKLEEQIEDTEAEKAAAEADTFKDGTLTAEGNGYTITMDYTADAKIPENAKLSVREITAETDKDTYENCLAQAKQHMADSGNAKPAVDTYASRFFDIEILTDEGKIEPAAPVNVNIQILDTPVVTSEEEKQPEPTILHFGENGVEQIDASTNEGAADIQNAGADSVDSKDANTEQTGNSDTTSADQEATQIRFEAESFSVYGVVYSITKTVITAKGETYEITVSYDENANIPDGAELNVRELEENSQEYLDYSYEAWKKINEPYFQRQERIAENPDSTSDEEGKYIRNFLETRFFDITFTYKGEIIEPKAPVTVNISLKDGLKTIKHADTNVIHFEKNASEDNEKGVKRNDSAADGTTAENIENVKTRNSGDKVNNLTFEQDSFSVDGLITNVEASKITKSNMKLSAKSLSIAPPEAHKTKTENGDGTHKIHLTVKGTSEEIEEPEKANVIIVIDRSTSMWYGKADTVAYSTNGVPNAELDPEVQYYYSVPAGGGLNVYYNNYIPLQYQNGLLQTGNSLYTGNVYTFKSRLNYEAEALEQLIDGLLDQNAQYPGTIEIETIGFCRTNEIRQSWTTDRTDLINSIPNEDQLSDGTNWTGALKRAYNEAVARRETEPDQDVYVLFLTDGTPVYDEGTYYDNYNNYARQIANLSYGHLYNIFTFGTDDMREIHPDHDYPLANAIWASNGGRYSSAEELGEVTTYAYGSNAADHFFDAREPQDLIDAFSDIFSKITESIAYGKAKITDEMATDVAGTTLVEGKADGFTYVVTSNNGNELYSVTATGNSDNPTVTFTIGAQTSTGYKRTETIDGRQYTYYSNYETTPTTSGGTPEYKMGLANIDSNGKVTWDLTGIGPLEDEYIYECNFDVWPNQDAFDTLAALNNGTTTWNESTQVPVKDDDGNTLYYMNGVPEFPHIVKYEDGTYRALSNKSQKLDYAIVNSTTTGGVTETTYEDQEPIDLEYPEPMSLEKEKIKVKKDWEDDLSPAELNDLLTEKLKADGTVDYSVKLRLWQDKDTADEKEVTTETDTDGFNIIPTVTVEDGKVTSSVWPEKEAYIAPGVMVISTPEKEKIYSDTTKYPRYSLNGVTYIQLETGHQYELTEDNTDPHFELDTEPFHPMMINDELYAVKFENGEMTEATKMANTPTITATNVLKGGINITKIIVDKNGNTVQSTDKTTEFTVHGSITKGGTGTSLDYRLIGEEYTDENGKSGRSPKVTISDSSDFSITLHAGDYIRIVNVPSGYSYSFYEETLGENIPYTFYSISGTAKNSAGADVAGANISISADQKTLSGTTVPNAAQNVEVRNKQPEKGSLKIQKIVTYNGMVPSTDAQKTKMAGTYTFTIYKDEACNNPYQETPGTNKTVSITIENNGQAVTSDEITGLPVGDYWIKETEPGNGSSPVVNPVKATVEAGKTGTAAPIVSVTNNYADGPDQAFITVRKTFSGIKKEEIPENFSITITDGENTYTLTNKSEGNVVFSESADGLTWNWKILNVPTGKTYTISESNENIQGYTVTTTGTGASQTIQPADITLNTIGEVHTHNSQKVWPVDTNTMFLCTLTNAHHGTSGILVVSKESLSMSVRKAIEEWAVKLTPGDWVDPFYYYSTDEHPDGFQVNGGTVTYDAAAGTVTFTNTEIWKQNASVSVTYNKPDSADFNVTNDYTSIPVDLDVLKVDKNNVTKKLPGAQFTLKQLNPDLTGARYLTRGIEIVSDPTDAYGKTSFKQLTTGYYEIDETKTPEGYVKTEDSKFYIKVYAGAITFIKYDSTKKPTEWGAASNTTNITFELAKAANPQTGTAAQNATATVKNEPGAELPSTGGPGTRFYTILGTMLITLGAAMLLFRRQTR